MAVDPGFPGSQSKTTDYILRSILNESNQAGVLEDIDYIPKPFYATTLHEDGTISSFLVEVRIDSPDGFHVLFKFTTKIEEATLFKKEDKEFVKTIMNRFFKEARFGFMEIHIQN